MRLPERFRGYSTKELILFWDLYYEGRTKDAPREKILAMQDLIYEEKLAPVTWKTPQDREKARKKIAELMGCAPDAQ